MPQPTGTHTETPPAQIEPVAADRTRLVDSHCHLDRLDLEPFDGALAEALADARQRGVEHLLCVNINLEGFEQVYGIARAHAGVSASVGVHPSETEGAEPQVDQLTRLAARPGVVAIGETGLDYHYNRGDLEWQRDRFRTHIRVARESGKPLIIHSRDAREDTLRILREEHAEQVGGVMHCFTEDWDMAQRAMDLGFFISLSGIVTFKRAHQVQEVAARVPLDRLLVETDAPYLTPVPYRGKPNRPGYVRYVAQQVAALRGLDLESLAEATTANFYYLFPGAASPPPTSPPEPLAT